MTTAVPPTTSDADPCPRDSEARDEAESTSEAVPTLANTSADAHGADAPEAAPEEPPLTVSDAVLCPLDAAVPEGAPSALADAEDVILAVRYKKHLVKDDKGNIVLAPMSLSEKDIKGVIDKDTQAKRNVSVLRSITPANEIDRRLVLLCQENAWKSDPVEAVANAGSVRSAKDNKDRQLFCLFSEPASDPEPFGDCPTHAGIVKTKPLPYNPKEQMQWLLIKTKLAAQFKTVRHRSGKVPVLDEQVAG